MKLCITTFLTTLLLIVTTTYGQTYQPLDLAKKVFSGDSLPNIDNYATGEYNGSPNGKDLQKGATTKFTLLTQTEKTAVVAMTILDSLGKGLDTYLHFEKDTIWRISAFRALAMTGIIERAKIELEKLTLQQVDDIIVRSKKKGNDHFSMFTSRDDYSFQLGNTKLTLELDDNIIEHFKKNQAEFERLKNLALKQVEEEKVDDERSIKLIESLKADYQKILVASVSSGGYELGKSINFLIGGMLDNSVGYIFVKDKKDLPEMNPARVIMIREIGNGWYIYKTT